MPIIKSAVKKMKQDQRRYAQNLRTKRAMRAAIKAFEDKPTFDTLREAQSKIDTAVKKKVLTKQSAARRLSHLSKKAKNAGVKIVAVKKSASVKSPAKPTVKSAEKPASTKTAKTATKKPVVAKKTVKKEVK